VETTLKTLKKHNNKTESEPATYAGQCEHAIAEPLYGALDLVLILALLTYIRNQKMQKSKTNIDSNPNPTIDKAAKRKETEQGTEMYIRTSEKISCEISGLFR